MQGSGFLPAWFKIVRDGFIRVDIAISALTSAFHGSIRSELKGAGKPIGSNDPLIAAHATGATIVTANVDEFRRIRGLKVENCFA
jgi:predicted nucleic acid-binding protein